MQNVKSYEDVIVSLTGAKWCARLVDNASILKLVQKYDISELSARILLGRNVDHDVINEHIKPTLRHFLPDPYHLLDMDKAVEIIIDALNHNKKIMILGDYDVDGATSSALLLRYFDDIGYQNIEYYIPDRNKDGYGPTVALIEKFKAANVDLIITADCGTLAFEAFSLSKELGIKTIVLDHHQSGYQLPAIDALINPNRFDQPQSPVSICAAVGISFIMLVALQSSLEKQGYFADHNKPDLMNSLDLVALGTVCDVMPLVGINRAFVTQGLKVMRKLRNLGLKTLVELLEINDIPSSYHLSFVIGPVINAGGRLGDSLLGTDLLRSNDQDRVKAIAVKLNKYNQERRAIELLVLTEAMQMVEQDQMDLPIICVVGYGWHSGVLGIVASRLKERFNKPALVITVNDEGIGKGSSRSITGFDIGKSMIQAFEEDILINGGGHAMAAGFSVKEDMIETLHQYLIDKIQASLPENLSEFVHKFDNIIDLAAVHNNTLDQIVSLEPFGAGYPEPLFIINNVQIVKIDLLKNGTVRCIIGEYPKTSISGKTIPIVIFKAADKKLETILQPDVYGQPLQILCKLKYNSWKGRNSVNVIVEDIAKV